MYNQEIETLAIEELRILQSERLVNLVKRLYENVLFYKKQFDKMGLNPSDIKSIEDLSKIPFTKKQI